MIKKRYMLGFLFLIILLIGTVSAENVDNTTEKTATTLLKEDRGVISETSPIVETKNLTMYYKDGAHEVNIYDSDKKPISGVDVNITINGVTYNRITDSEGFAKLNINLNPGDYEVKTESTIEGNHIIKINYIHIKPMNTTILGDTYVEMAYKNGKYSVQLIGGDNKPLTNQEIIFTINQVSYSRFTNDEGIASLNINLNPDKVYVIKSEYRGFEYYQSAKALTGHIAINHQKTKLIGNPLEMEYKSGKYSVKLVNSNNISLSNQKIIFTINGVEYTRITNSTGDASLNINLNPGQYQIRYRFEETTGYSGSSGSNMINIRENKIILTGLNKNIIFDSDETYMIELTDDGEPVKDIAVKSDIYKDSKLITTFNSQTITDGIARVELDLDPGTYEIRSIITQGGYICSPLIDKITVTAQNLTAESRDLILNQKGNYFTVNLKNKATNQNVDGEEVEFTINGVSYIRVTDANGNAKLKINLEEGEYIIQWKYVGSKGYNEISGSNKIIRNDNYNLETILTIPSTNMSKKGDIFEVILKDSNGLPVEGEKISFTSSGKQYFETTDENGVASFKVYLEDGTHSVYLRHGKTAKYGVSHETIELNVNTTPNFNYKIQIENGVTVNDTSIGFIRDIEIISNNKNHYFTYDPYYDGSDLKNNEKYFISVLGDLKKDDFNEQGISLEVKNNKLEITYFGRTNENVSQFSAIYTPVEKNGEKWENIDLILENEKVATIKFSEKYINPNTLNDLIKINYPFVTFEQINRTLTIDEFVMNKTSYIDYGYGSLYEWDSNREYEILESYVLGESKVSEEMVEKAIAEKANLNEDYLKDAYDFYLVGLDCLWSSTYLNDKLAENNNVRWDRETLLLVYSDWLGIKLDTQAKNDVYGNNENDIKNFKVTSSIVFSLCEKTSLQLLGVESLSAVSEIYDGINEGKSLVVDKIDDLVIIRIANSTNSLVINITSGNTNAYVTPDLDLISQKITLKGASTLYGIYFSTEDKVEDGVSYQKIILKNFMEFINPFNDNIKIDMDILMEFGGKLLPTAINAASAGEYGILSMVYIIYEGNNLLIEYRDKYVDDKYWQFLPKANSFNAKIIHVNNPETGYKDFVEIPYDSNRNLDIDNANYIDLVYGRRDLTSSEKEIFSNWDESPYAYIY